MYYVDQNFVRHPFYNVTIFATYQSSFDNVQTVTDATLPLMALGAPMLPNPDVILIKWESLNDVYLARATDKIGTGLRRTLADEATAGMLLGSMWADYVIDLPSTLWSSYADGEKFTAAETAGVDVSKFKKRMNLKISNWMK